MEIYADTQRDMHNALYDGGKVDYEGWASRYLSEDEQAIWKVINVQTGESLQDGALYTKNEADELLQNLTADKLIKNGEEIFASFDTDELLRYRRAQIENDVYR